MSYQCVLFERREGIARLTLNRPERLNSFNLQMHEEVRRAPISELVLAPADDRVRAFATALAEETSVKIALFEPERLFQIADGVEIDVRWNALIALGAALRAEQTDA